MSAILRDFARYPGSFWGASSGEIPRPFPAAAGPGAGGMMPLRCATLWRRAMSGLKGSGLADFLTPLEALVRPAPG
jgi:hypothetical protein